MAMVMVVDDEQNMIDVVGLLLKSEGFEVCGALGGKECLESVERINPDILLIDVMMPDMDGWDLVRELKNRGLTDLIRMAMLTVVEKPPDEHADLGSYVLDYIRKPFDRRDLIRRVKRLDSL